MQGFLAHFDEALAIFIRDNHGLLRRSHDAVIRVYDEAGNALPLGRLWYGEPDAVSNAIGFAKFYSRLDQAVIRV